MDSHSSRLPVGNMGEVVRDGDTQLAELYRRDAQSLVSP
jgi:hypothetical protein